MLLLLALALVLNATSDASSLLPTPVTWALAALAAILLAASTTELLRRAARRPPREHHER